MSAPNWVKYVSTKYKEDLDRLKANIGSDKPSAKDIEKHFEKQFTFYRKTLEKYLVAKREEKKFSAVVSRALNPFIRMVCFFIMPAFTCLDKILNIRALKFMKKLEFMFSGSLLRPHLIHAPVSHGVAAMNISNFGNPIRPSFKHKFTTMKVYSRLQK